MFQKNVQDVALSLAINTEKISELTQMFSDNNEKFYLPAWRNGQLLFFTNYCPPNSSRIEYIVAAFTKPNETQLHRSGKAQIDAANFKFCQRLVNDGIELQKFFAALGSGNLEHLAAILRDKSIPSANTKNALIYVCMFLDFLRKYAVDTEITRLYSEGSVRTRFNPDRSVGIYKILTARLQSSEAEKLVDADMEKSSKLQGKPMSIANLLRACAIVKSDLGKYSEAESFMLRAIKRHDTEDKWRRLGDFAYSAGERDKAVEYFLKAHEVKPLPASAALIVGRCLVEEGKFDQARPFVEQAAALFAKPAEVLMEKIDSST